MLPGLTVIDPLSAVLGAAVVKLPAPVWTPWPLPDGWCLGGIAYAEDGDSAGCTVASWLGTDPFGEPAELILVCEEAGAGVGSHFAGLSMSYPSAGVGEGPPHARFSVQGRPVPLWSVEGPGDRAVYAGEAAGRWLWVIVHPAEASALVVAPIRLLDARGLGAELAGLPIGELSPRLVID
jgi:hypothetical protein